jgi:DNA-binding NarL/FixJ family response regulator
VFVIGDHPVVNAGLARLIKSAPDLSLCGSGRCTPTLLEQLKAVNPELVILDLTPSVRGFLDLLSELKSCLPAALILVLCDKADQLEASRAVTLGASGIIMKHQSTEMFLSVIRHVLSRTASAARHGSSCQHQPSPAASLQLDRLDVLTEREREVLRLTGLGKTPLEIAQALGVSIKTVATHRCNIKEKLGIESSTQLMRRALQLHRLASTDPITQAPSASAPGP